MCHRALILAGLLAAVVLAGCDNLRMKPPQVRKSHEERRLDAGKRLRVNAEVAAGNLNVDKAVTGLLYTLDTRWDAANVSRRVDCRAAGDGSVLEIALRGKTPQSDENRVDLSLSDQVPLELELETGVGESRIDLSGLQVETVQVNQGVGSLRLAVDESQAFACREFEVQCGVGEMELRGLANLAPRRFRLKGGIGHASVNFSGQGTRDIDAQVEVGIGQIDIILPEGLGVRIRTERERWGAGLSLPADRFQQQGSYSVTPDYEKSAQKLDLVIHAGLGQVCIRF